MSLKSEQLLTTFADALKKSKEKTKPYDTTATVTRTDGNIVWVHISGGVEETPVIKSIDCKEGDSVQVRISGGKAWITGNTTAPPTDDAKANKAYVHAETANTEAVKAKETALNAEEEAQRAYRYANDAESQARRAQASADDAQDSADSARNSADSALVQLSTVERVVDVLNWIAEHGTYKTSTDTEVVSGKLYFTRTGSGTEANPYVYTVVENPTGNPSTKGYYELDSVDEAISNYVSSHLALTDDGLYVLKDSSGWRLLVANNGVYVQNPSGSIVATYSANTIVGNALLKNVLVDSSGVQVRDGSIALASFTGSSAQIGKSSASHSVVDTNGMRIYASDGITQIANLGYGEGNTESGTAEAPYFTFGKRSSGTIGNYSVAEGIPIISGSSELYPHNASGYCSHAEGGGTRATKAYAHAEGYGTLASGFSTHTEGALTSATQDFAHAEGKESHARAEGAHAEGNNCYADGKYSHAQNDHTIADGDCQTVLGKYNLQASGFAIILGNGDNSRRSNALTVDWNGNVNIGSGAKYKINGTDLSASDVDAPSTGDTSWSHIGSSTDFNYIKRSGLVFVDFYKASQALSTSWTTIGTLPSGYRPAHTIYGSAISLTTTAIAYYINSSGTVAMRTASGSGSYATGFNVTFPVL